MRSINYNFDECTTYLNLINYVDLWEGPHLDDIRICVNRKNFWYDSNKKKGILNTVFWKIAEKN